MKKNLKNFYKFVRVKVKRSAYNLDIIKKLKTKNSERINNRNKKLYNFIRADDLIKEHKTGKKIENVEGFSIHLYKFTNAYIDCCNNCAFVRKFAGGKYYTLKESAGIIARLDEKGMYYAPPYDLESNPKIEEDEVCILCFLQGENYWHYTFEVVPRILIMIRRGYKGKFLVNDTFSTRQFTELLSIPEDRLIINQPGKIIHAKKLWISSELYGIELRGNLLAATRTYLLEEAEKKFGALDDEKYPKRLYITRVASRKIINEAQIVDFLHHHGFEIIVPEKLSVYQQMKFFHNAEIIVTPHGANCTNVLYCKAETSFVECFGHMWINPCMLYTIDFLNIDYHMLCERFADYDKNAHKFSDYIINPLLMQCTIEKILEQRENVKGASK